MKATIENIYAEKGLNGVYSFLRKNAIPHTVEVREFGLDSNQTAKEEKTAYLKGGELRFHYHSLSVRSRKTGWSYNRVRAIGFILN